MPKASYDPEYQLHKQIPSLLCPNPSESGVFGPLQLKKSWLKQLALVNSLPQSLPFVPSESDETGNLVHLLGREATKSWA